MQFKLRLIPAATVAVIVAACGGGSGSSGPATAIPTGGVAVDGYLQFSKITCDTNDNGVANPDEPITYTLVDGKFSFPQGCTHGMILSGGKSADTGLMLTGLLKTPAGATVISPLTTLISAGLSQAEINNTLGLPAGTDLLKTDPAAASTGGVLNDPALMKKTLAVQQLLQKTTETLAGLAGAAGSAAVEPIYNEVAIAFASILKSGTPLIISNGTAVDLAIVNTLVKAAGQRIAQSSVVMTEVKAALTKMGGASVLANVISNGLRGQADAYLKASNDAATITQVTLNLQGNDGIKDTVGSLLNSGLLSEAATSANILLLSDQVMAAAEKPTSTFSPSTPTPAPVTPANPSATTKPSVFISFDETIAAFSDMGAYGGALPSVEAAPTGGSGSALKILKSSGQETWGGVYFTTAALPFTTVKKMITANVYSTRANVVIKFKVEIPGGSNVEVSGTPTGAANTWSTVNWDFGAVDVTQAYKVIAITPDNVSNGGVYYLDDLAIVAGGVATPTTTPSTPPPSPVPSPGVMLSFDESPAKFTDIYPYGGAIPSIAAGPTGSVGSALKIVKPPSGNTWGGVAFPLSSAVPFSATQKQISASVYSTKANVVYKFKVEVPGGVSLEVASTPTGAANTWSTVSWDFSGIDLTKAYTLIAITPDVVSDGNTYYVDEIKVVTNSAAPLNYLYLANNALSLFNGSATTSYSMTQFQSDAGIAVKWPMSSDAAIKLNLAENGSFVMANGQTLSAAVSITQVTPSGFGEVKAYIDSVNVTKVGSSIQVSVPNVANAMVYGVSGDGKTKAVISFSDAVRKNITNTLSSAANAISTIMLGDVVNYAVNGVSNDFTGMNALRGKYKVSIVVNNLPLRKVDGSSFPTMTVQAPTALNSSGVATTMAPVTGPGLEGYITLTD